VSPVDEYAHYVAAQVNLVLVCDRAAATLRRIAKKLERDARKYQKRVEKRIGGKSG
jgi:hypothetical protein